MLMFFKVLRRFAVCAIFASVCTAGAYAQQYEQGAIANPDAAANLANQAFQAGKWDEALKLVDGLLSFINDPKAPQLEMLWVMQGACYFNKGEYAKAEEIYRKFLETFPASPQAPGAKMTLGQTLALQKKWDDAAAIFKELEQNPDLQQEALQYGAQVAVQSGKSNDAIEALVNVVKSGAKTPDTMDAALALVRLYIDGQQFEKATEGLQFLRENQALIDNLPELNRLALALGDKYRDVGEFRKALSAYRTVRPKEALIAEQNRRTQSMEREKAELERNQVMQVDKIRLSRLNARLSSVNTLLRAIQKLDDYDASLYLRRGRAYQQQGRYWETILLNNEVLEKFPDSPECKLALYSLMESYSRLGRKQKALEYAERFIEKYPQDGLAPMVLFQAGYIAMDMRDFDKAREYFRRGIDQFGDSAEMRQNFMFFLGNSYFSQYKFAEAREQALKYLSEYPAGTYDEDIRFQIACTYFYSANPMDSVKWMKEYIEKYPAGKYTADARYRLIVLDFAQAGNAEGDGALKQVVDDCNAWLADYAQTDLAPELYNILGDTQMMLGETEKAIEAYRAAVGKSRSVDTISYALDKATKAYQSLGRYADVEKMHEDFIQSSPKSPLVPNSIYWISRMRVRQGKLEDAKRILAENIREHIDEPEQQAVEKLIFQLAQLTARRPRGEPGQKRPELPPLNVLSAQLENWLGSSDVKTPLARARIFLARAELAALTKNPAEESRIYGVIGEDLKPEDLSPGLLARVGDNELKRGEFDKAKPFFEQLVRVYPKTEFADYGYVGLGDIAYAKGDYEGARQWFTDALKKTETVYKRAEALLGQARADYALGKLDAAEAVFQDVVSNRSWRGEATAIGVYYLGLIDLKRAQSLAGEARKEKLASAHAYFQRTYLAYQKFPQWVAKAYLSAGETLAQMGDLPQALSTYTRMLANPKIEACRAELAEGSKRAAALRAQGIVPKTQDDDTAPAVAPATATKS